MTTSDLKPLDLIQAHSATPPGLHFYASLESVLQDESALGYFSVMKRAWREMKLDGVLFLDGCPVLYLKEYARPFTVQERLFQQRLFWNQGVANVLVLADPTSAFIYSGLAGPAKDHTDQSALENVLVDTLTLADYVSQIQSLYHSLATGHFYEVNQRHFDPSLAVDARLLDNLRVLRDSLTQGDEKLNIQKAHALIGRLLFLCYLLDREIFSIDNSGGNCTGTVRFTEVLEKQPDDQRIDYLYDIFTELKEQFNGNMFDQDLYAEKVSIKPSHLNKLILFLGGHDVKSGQRSFWPYDFKMIPVETISAIYQDFLAVEDPEKQRKRGAFYTPRFLAEAVVDMALCDDPDVLDGSFLDPACGSGIFLVILFSRLANRWLLQNKRAHYTTKVKAFQKILSRQIHGVDLEETACRIACFSLYLAYLDFFDPPDIQEHIERTGRPLPKLLDYGNTPDRPFADIPVIYMADFLVDEIFTGQAFDCVIGNPPWEGRGKKQLAQKFMQHTPEKLKEGGIGCLLLPTKILQNQTDVFQAEWLSQVTLEKVLQLADYRRLLFQGAKTPAFIARFVNTPPESNSHTVHFNAPKFNREGLRQGIIKINPSSRTWIPLADILTATRSKIAPVVWKRRLWGTARDQKLLDFLQALSPLSELAGEPNEGKKWVKGQGFQPYYPEKAVKDPKYPKPKLNPWALNTLLIHMDQSHQMLLFKHDCMCLEAKLNEIGGSTKFLRRLPNSHLFKSPMVLVSRGSGNVAYCDFDVIFQHYVQSIAGPKEDASLLMFLSVLLRSKLTQYFLFHTAANLGTERDYVTLSELLRVPFPLPGSEFVSPKATLIVDQVTKKVKRLRNGLKNRFDELMKQVDRNAFFDEAHKQVLNSWHRERIVLVDELQNELEPLIYQYFGLTAQEIALIEDTTNIFITSSTPTTWRTPKSVTLDPVEKSKITPYAENGLGVYADTLTSTLNAWAKEEGANRRVCAEGGKDSETGLAMVTIYLSQKETPYIEKSITKDLFNTLKTYYDSISNKHGVLKYERDILLFKDETIHIVRPNILFNWTRTAALNDAAKIYGEIALSRREP